MIVVTETEPLQCPANAMETRPQDEVGIIKETRGQRQHGPGQGKQEHGTRVIWVEDAEGLRGSRLTPPEADKKE